MDVVVWAGAHDRHRVRIDVCAFAAVLRFDESRRDRVVVTFECDDDAVRFLRLHAISGLGRHVVSGATRRSYDPDASFVV